MSSCAREARTTSMPRLRAIAGPGRAVGVVADVTIPDGATAVVDAAVEQFGGLDIVVNNVGGSGARTFAEMDAADLQAVLDKNLFPALNVSRAALPALRERGGGVIAMIASIWGGRRRRAELQRREGGGDQPCQGDGARSRAATGSASSASRRARRCSPAGAGSGACATIPKAWRRSSSASFPGAGSAPPTRSPTSVAVPRLAPRVVGRRRLRRRSTAASRGRSRAAATASAPDERAGARDYPPAMEVAGRTVEPFEERVRAHEEAWLSPLAVRSFETRGRAEPEAPCGVRTPFQRDRDRLVHSKPFRRLKGKTQVFIDPEGDHYRTRMTHTLETTAISRVVARALRLNEDLVEAIGLGHDTGHTPFGHAGEQALDDALNAAFGRRFRHNEQSWRIARRLNLTHEVCDGILTHTGAQEPETLEGKIVRVVDRVAYINHDIDDAIRYGILSEADLPRAEIALLGADRLRADRPARPRPRRDLRAGGRHPAERRDRRGDAVASRVHVRPRLPRPARRARAPARRTTSCRRSSRGSSPTRSCCRPATASSPTGSPTTSPG